MFPAASSPFDVVFLAGVTITGVASFRSTMNRAQTIFIKLVRTLKLALFFDSTFCHPHITFLRSWAVLMFMSAFEACLARASLCQSASTSRLELPCAPESPRKMSVRAQAPWLYVRFAHMQPQSFHYLQTARI